MKINPKMVAIAIVAIVIVVVRLFLELSWWRVLGIVLALGVIVFIGPIVGRMIASKFRTRLQPLINVATSPAPNTGVGELMPPKYGAIIAFIYLAYFAVFAAFTAVTMVFVGWVGLAWVAFALTFAGYYTVASFKKIGPDEQAAKTFFGKAIQNLDSGLCFAPLGICEAKMCPKNLFDFYIGQERDKDGKPVVREYEGIVYQSEESFRVTFASYDHAIWTLENRKDFMPKEEKVIRALKGKKGIGDPLNHRLTTDPRVAIIGRIVDPKQFIIGVGDLNSAFRKTEKVVTATLQEYCAKRTPSFVQFFLADAVETVKDKVEKLIGDPDKFGGVTGLQAQKIVSWGIDITEVKITSMGFDYLINKAMVGAREASYILRKTIETGRGVAEARRLLLEAEASGEASYVRQLDALNNPELARLIVTADAAKEMAKEANLVITPQDNLFGWLAGAQQLFKATQKSQSEEGQEQNQPRSPQGGGRPQGQSRGGQRGGGQSGGAPQGNPQPGPNPQGGGQQGPKPGGPTPTPPTPETP